MNVFAYGYIWHDRTIYTYVDNIGIYVIYTYTSIFNQQLHIEEIDPRFHLVPGIPVFWFSATQSLVHRWVPIETGLLVWDRMSTEMKYKH